MNITNEENIINDNSNGCFSGIARKLVLIMGECSHVAKDGFNDYHKYKYASASGVLETINAALVKHKVASIVTPAILSSYDVTNARGNVEHQVTVGCNILLIDSESGESIDLYGIGTGQDAGDKAVMKAETASIKYAYMMAFNICQLISGIKTWILRKKSKIKKTDLIRRLDSTIILCFVQIIEVSTSIVC